MRPIGDHLIRWSMGASGTGEAPRGSLGIASLRPEHVDDLAVLVDRPVDVPPAAGDLHVGLVDEPTAAGAMPTWSGRVHQQWRDPLDPSEQGDLVDLDAAFSEELLEIPVRQPVPQVPAHGDQDDLRREPEPGEP